MYSFKRWLKLQINRHDPIGDLAVDASHAYEWNSSKARSCDALEDILIARCACTGAFEALDQAREEYQIYKNRARS